MAKKWPIKVWPRSREVRFSLPDTFRFLAFALDVTPAEQFAWRFSERVAVGTQFDTQDLPWFEDALHDSSADWRPIRTRWQRGFMTWQRVTRSRRQLGNLTTRSWRTRREDSDPTVIRVLQGRVEGLMHCYDWASQGGTLRPFQFKPFTQEFLNWISPTHQFRRRFEWDKAPLFG